MVVDPNIMHIFWRGSGSTGQGYSWPFVDSENIRPNKYIFSRSCQLEEFRIYPRADLNINSQIDLILNFDIGGGALPLIKHRILAADSDRNDPKKFDMAGGVPISPAKGTRMWIQQIGGVGAFSFMYSMWGRWT